MRLSFDKLIVRNFKSILEPLCLDFHGSDEVLSVFPKTSPSKSNIRRNNAKPKTVAKGKEYARVSFGHDDDGGSVARIFQTIKAAPVRRQRLRDGTTVYNLQPTHGVEYKDKGGASRIFYTAKADAIERIGDAHPTVKPVDLICYLTRLITPPNGIVLDLFAGTGTTAEAAFIEGFSSVLIEREQSYTKIIRDRMRTVQRPFSRTVQVANNKSKRLSVPKFLQTGK